MKNVFQYHFWWAPPKDHFFTSKAGTVKSSGMPMPRGFFASGFRCISTNSGTMTVRAQYDTLSRWNGNHFGRSMISIGMVGTAAHGTCPYSASRMRVNTLLLAAPP